MAHEWSLKEMYTGYDDPNFLKDFEALDTLRDDVMKAAQNEEGLDDLNQVRAILLALENHRRTARKIGGYAHLRMSVQATDGETVSWNRKISAKGAAMALPVTMANKVLARYDEETVAKWAEKDELIAAYTFLLAENRNAAIERLTVLSSAERAQFCRAVAKAAYDTDGKSIVDMLCMQDTSDTHSRFADAYDEYDEYDGYDDDDGDERNKTDAGRISYLRNYYADAAYTVFASVIDEPTVMYNSDFAGVCEDVYYGRAGCCILPVESSSDGRHVPLRSSSIQRT